MEENCNMEDAEHPFVPVQGRECMQRHLSAKSHHLHLRLTLCIWIWSEIYLNLCCLCKLSDKFCNIIVLGHSLLFHAVAWL